MPKAKWGADILKGMKGPIGKGGASIAKLFGGLGGPMGILAALWMASEILGMTKWGGPAREAAAAEKGSQANLLANAMLMNEERRESQEARRERTLVRGQETAARTASAAGTRELAGLNLAAQGVRGSASFTEALGQAIAMGGLEPQMQPPEGFDYAEQMLGL